jgi:hypothetical protein
MHALLPYLIQAVSQLPGLLTGILLTVVGVHLHRRSDERKKHEEVVFQIYMRLFDLHGRHFWIYSQEASGRQLDPRPGVRFNKVRWRLADLLRKADRLPEVPEILRAMFSLSRFESEKARHEEIGRLMEVLGARINPRYNKAMQEICAEDQKMMLLSFDGYWRRKNQLGG